MADQFGKLAELRKIAGGRSKRFKASETVFKNCFIALDPVFGRLLSADSAADVLFRPLLRTAF